MAAHPDSIRGDLPMLQMTIDRAAITRYGINVADVQQLIIQTPIADTEILLQTPADELVARRPLAGLHFGRIVDLPGLCAGLPGQRGQVANLEPDGKRVAALMPAETPEARQAQTHIVFLLNFSRVIISGSTLGIGINQNDTMIASPAVTAEIVNARKYPPHLLCRTMPPRRPHRSRRG
jgi:hypothetical protein